jgi:pimeloyl-ACP methyl ester carboxylesterase
MMKRTLLSSAILASATALPTTTPWTTLPSDLEANNITWSPCPALNDEISTLNGVRGATFDCASLPVPLDYTSPQTSPLITLSLFKVNATHQPSKGSILFNPGGPGGSGAENLPLNSIQLQKHIGGHYDIVSWDPRGTGKTMPFNCTPPADDDDAKTSGAETLVKAYAHPSSNAKRAADSDLALASANLTQYFLETGYEVSVQKAATCAEVQAEIGPYVGTTSTAYDMLSIVDALGEDGQLRFWGWSYGSVLGEYFATLFPERVERMVLDSVMDPHFWTLGHRANFLDDTDAALRGFAEQCVLAGTECAIVNATGIDSAEGVFEWANELLLPIVELADGGSDEAYVALQTFKSPVYLAMYFPAQWPSLARQLVAFAAAADGEVESEDGAAMSAPAPYSEGLDAAYGIRCSDAVYQVSSAEEYLPIVQYQEGTSASFADVLGPAHWECASWTMPNKGRFEGFKEAWTNDTVKFKTKTPILFVNGPFDVSTPLQGAYNASMWFEDSVVLKHTGYGHGLPSSPSKCAAEHIERYFDEGALPEEGVVCEPDFESVWELAADQLAELAPNVVRPDNQTSV